MSTKSDTSRQEQMDSSEVSSFKRISEGSPNKSKKVKLQSYSGRDKKSNQMGYVEVNKLEHCIRSLQKNLKYLIDEVPDTKELQKICKSRATESSTKSDLKDNKLAKLAAQLKYAYRHHKLNIFDSILNNEFEFQVAEVDEETSASSSVEEDSDRGDDLSDIKISSEGNVQDIPVIPQIKNSKLFSRVFIHKSVINNKSYLNKAELMASHNERLEFYGDSVLNNIVTSIIFFRFPEASEGELSKIRSQLVNNITLAEYSFLYGFDKRLRSNIKELRNGDGTNSTQKIYADLFESYVGALALERALDFSDIRAWLTDLMLPRLDEITKQINNLEEVNKDAKTQLYSLIGTAAFHPQYETIQFGDGASVPFITSCRMGDDILGIGTAPGNKEAGLRAAMHALKNKELIEKYGRIRSQMDKSVSVISNRLSNNGPKKEADTIISNKDKNFERLKQKIFPLTADGLEEHDVDAKGKLYSLLGKREGLSPHYRISELLPQLYEASLLVKDTVIATATDNSKKKATAKAALVLLKNKDALEAISSL